MKNIRLLPIVVLAASALLVLKVTGIVTGGGYTLTGVTMLSAQEQSGTVDEAALAAADVAARALFDSAPSPTEGGAPIPVMQFDSRGAGGPVALVEDDTEAVILERLAVRRAELDALAQELELRLAVVEAAETRLEERMTQIAALEARINATVEAQEAREVEQFASIVSMYENMRPADAATIFNDLDMDVLLRVSKSMNPRKLGPIMAKMIPEKAQHLTVQMAGLQDARAGEVIQGSFAHLPQIVGE